MKIVVLKPRDALLCYSLAGHYQKRDPLYSYRKPRRCYVTVWPATSSLDVLPLYATYLHTKSTMSYVVYGPST
jgi:hypothetical protein